MRIKFTIITTGASSVVLALSMGVAAQPTREPGQTLAERLGYARDARLVVVHADDMGQAHGINMPSMDAFEKGIVNNASILVPCPWFPEVVQWAKQHPDYDLGMQATLTSEQQGVKWGPVLGAQAVPSLVDSSGYFPADGASVAARARPEEVEAEIRAQLQKLRNAGIKPSYLDTHMGVMFATPALFKVYLRIAREAGIVALIPREYIKPGRFHRDLVGPEDVIIDAKISGDGHAAPVRKIAQAYQHKLKSAGPGVYFLEAHLGLDTEEMRGLFAGQKDWGVGFRSGEAQYFMSPAFSAALRQYGWHKITFTEIARKLGIGQADKNSITPGR